jgi:hypothetical protein
VADLRSAVNPRAEKAFDFALDVTKQLITLATAVIALTITFLTDVAKEASADTARWLQAGWVFYLVSIAFGILTLMALTGTLGDTKSSDPPSINASNILMFAKVQVGSFFVAVALTLVFGFKAV